ncbi:MAG TPA: hypothetical protein PK986_07275 [Spirochaetota bacterium]|nr:STAS domain-containing protein [Spirochaetota bacterium]HQO40253.1 hypothetical protein [Spirochaetota bacterium]
MNYSLLKMKDYVLIKVKGKIDTANVVSAGSFIRELEIPHPATVILDVDGLEEHREMFYHVAMINSIQKEVNYAGGELKVRTSGSSLKKYLNMMGLKRLFTFDESIASAEA